MPEIDTELGPTTESKANIKDVLRAPETREIGAFLISQFFAFLVYMSVRQLFPLYLLEKESTRIFNYSSSSFILSFGNPTLSEFTSTIEAAVLVQWGIIVTAYTFAGLLGRVPAGWLIENVGRKKIIIISFSLMVTSVGLLPLTNNTALLALLFIILRLTNNTFGLASRSLLSDVKSGYKGLYNSLISSSGRLGSLVGTLSLGFVLDFFPGYIMILCALVLAAIGFGAFLLVFVKGKAEAMHFIRRVDIKSGKREKFDFKIFKSRTFIFFGLSFIIFGLLAGIVDPIMSLYGKSVLDLSESSIGMIIGLSQLSFVLISPFIGWIISSRPKMSDRLLIISSFILIGNYLMIYLMPYSPIVYTAVLFIKNVAHALFFPVVFTILTYELPKAHFSIIYSILTTGFFVGITATAYLSTYLYNISELLPWLFAWISAIVLTITVIIYALLRKKSKPLVS